ncbi:MAG: DUF4347 domain-containing protein [Rhodoferax sp.]|nr:DUF4347 domain-containing protein [Rhodoferax sp.]MDP3651270.1 DUF4347 domain-containing protein [Rhodoferax sp.]
MPSTTNIIFIDSRVTEYLSLLDGLPQPTEVFILDSESNGLTQILDKLKGRSGVDALHLVSHGSQGALYLGSTVLDSANLASFGSQLAGIGDAMTSTGDILLYGCNVAQGDLGQTFIEQLAVATRADVAASTNQTGAAALGGDWLLERATGHIDALTIAPTGYQFILPSESESNDTQSTANSLALDSAMAGNLSSANDVDYYNIAVASASLLSLSFDPLGNDMNNGRFTITLEDSLGNTLACSRLKHVTASVSQAGTYYARVGSFDSNAPYVGQYALTASYTTGDISGYESIGNDTPATADVMALGKPIIGQMSSALDVDYFAITLGAAGTLSLNFGGQGYPYSSVFKIALENSSGLTMASFSSRSESMSMTVGLSQPGTYYARVSTGGYDSYDMPYSLTATHEAGGSGLDEIHGSASDDGVHGGVGIDKIFGGAGLDALYGDAGSDTLDGGAGFDYLFGETGDDTYLVGFDQKWARPDEAIERPLEGTDTVLTSVDQYSLPENVEILVYTGATTFYAVGNELANIITGGSGSDTLNGGAGSDTLIGGTGDDTYHVDVQSDVVLESVGGGVDTVVASANVTLYDHVENLNLSDAWNTISGAGNALNNKIVGNGSNNLLQGLDGDDNIDGGTVGDDTLYGGNGNDTLTGGAGDDLLYGDAGNDFLFGGAGNDTLDGGAGQNLLEGGEGNDTYMIDSLDFDIHDSGGIDTAIISTSFVKLSTSIGIEKVIYTNGALALPYWIDALLPDQASGRFLTLLGPSRTIGYTYPTALPGYDTSAEDAYQFSGFNTAQKTFSKLALTYISSVLNLAFVEVSDPAAVSTISFGNNAQNSSAGYAFYPSSSFMGNDVFLDKNTPGNLAPVDGQYAALTLIHELGHSLGLEHPFPGSSDAPYLTGAEDSSQWTVMSYNDNSAQYHLAYSPLDIAALQYLYGVSSTAKAGNDTYTLNASSANFIWDGAGVDSMDASALAQAVTLYLEPGYWGHIGSKAATITAAGQVTVNFGTVIENLIGGAGDDFLYGSAGANSISGGFGADTLNPGSGADVVNAGAGNDTINLSADGVWTSGFAAANESLPGGAGTAQQVLLEGKNRFADVLDGGEGADTLQLTEGSDAFFLHDAYSLFNTSATLSSDARGMHSNARTTGIETLLAGAGDDIIDLTSLNYTLGGIRVEGGAGNDILWGNVGADQLLGGEGNDILFGGAGANTLTGGAGADIFQYAKGGSAHDSIGDFQMGSDKIELYGAISTDEVAVALNGDHVTLTWGAQTMDLVGITSTAGSNDWFHLA